MVQSHLDQRRSVALISWPEVAQKIGDGIQQSWVEYTAKMVTKSGDQNSIGLM